MSKAKLHKWQGQQFRVSDLANLKGLSRQRMASLIRDFGVDGAMEYDRNKMKAEADDRRKKRYELDGEKYTVKQLCQIAKVPCSVNRMHARIKEYGVRMAVDFENFENLKRSTGKKHKYTIPDLPEYNPEKHLIENMAESLKSQGMNDDQVYDEIKKRIAA